MFLKYQHKCGMSYVNDYLFLQVVWALWYQKL